MEMYCYYSPVKIEVEKLEDILGDKPSEFGDGLDILGRDIPKSSFCLVVCVNELFIEVRDVEREAVLWGME